METPKLGSIWKHLKTDGIYVVVSLGKREADLEPVVVYEREGYSDERWIRPVSEFMDGRFKEMIFAMPQEPEQPPQLIEKATDEQLKEGVKLDTGKHRIDLVAPELIFAVAAVGTFGAFKYTERNWEKGMKWGRVFAALMRHLWAWWGGKMPTTMNYLLGELDGETKMSHLWHAGWCIMALIAYEQRGVGTDDRMVTPDKLA